MSGLGAKPKMKFTCKGNFLDLPRPRLIDAEGTVVDDEADGAELIDGTESVDGEGVDLAISMCSGNK